MDDFLCSNSINFRMSLLPHSVGQKSHHEDPPSFHKVNKYFLDKEMASLHSKVLNEMKKTNASVLEDASYHSANWQINQEVVPFTVKTLWTRDANINDVNHTCLLFSDAKLYPS